MGPDISRPDLGLNESDSSGYYDDNLYLGRERAFDDRDLTTRRKPWKSARPVYARLVRNDNGSALEGGQAVKRSTYANGVAEAGSEEVAVGFVPGYIASVPDGACFYMVFEGPCPVQTRGTSVYVFGQRFVTAANGQVSELDATPGSDQDTLEQARAYVGTALEGVTNVAGTLFRLDVACRGH